ncbi:MAG: metallophosphoesterase, partial [Sphingopyxis sp.]
MHEFRFADRQFMALADRALFWPERRALLVADLHLEKASWFAMRGQMLPPFDSNATLARLIMLADRVDAAEIWALGDSFHDGAGPARLGRDAGQLLERLARGRRLVWIAGNHDAAAA